MVAPHENTGLQEAGRLGKMPFMAQTNQRIDGQTSLGQA